MSKGLVKTSRHKRAGMFHRPYASFPSKPSTALVVGGCIKFFRARNSFAAMKWSCSTAFSIQSFSILPLTNGRHSVRYSDAPHLIHTF
jgi:hypothetical protein